MWFIVCCKSLSVSNNSTACGWRCIYHNSSPNSNHIGDFDFSPVCVFKCVLKSVLSGNGTSIGGAYIRSPLPTPIILERAPKIKSTLVPNLREGPMQLQLGAVPHFPASLSASNLTGTYYIARSFFCCVYIICRVYTMQNFLLLFIIFIWLALLRNPAFAFFQSQLLT